MKQLVRVLALALILPLLAQPCLGQSNLPGTIYYVGSGQIYSYNLATSERTSLTTGFSPDVAPDGTLAFARYEQSSGLQIYLLEPGNSEPQRLTPCRTEQACWDSVWNSPSWSPDSTQLVLSAGDTVAIPSRPGAIGLAQYELVTINRETGEIARIFTNRQFGDGFQGCQIAHPAWSPDSSQIAFVRHCQGHLDVCVLTLASSEFECLSDQYIDNYPAWSPDGTRLAFVSNRAYRDRVGEYEYVVGELYVLDLQTNELQKLTQPGDFTESLGGYCIDITHPSWSPEGEQIVVECDYRLYLVSASTHLVTYLSYGTEPTWAG